MKSYPYQPRFVQKAKRGRNWIPKLVRIEVYSRDNNTCQYCRKILEPNQLTIEHIVPVIKSGLDSIVNYVTACRSCNSSKRDRPVAEFVKAKGIRVLDLPIHGDIILDTPELDCEYRKARWITYLKLRATNLLSGSNALKNIEREFYSRLWQTDYGLKLSKRFPELPTHVRASIPLVEYVVPDSRKPVYNILIEFCKSAHTRTLIDDMVRSISNSTCVNVDDVVASIIYGKHDKPTKKRVDQAFKRAKLVGDDRAIFDVPTNLEHVPLNKRDLLIVRIAQENNGFGLTEFSGYAIQVPETRKNQKVEIVIKKINPTFAEGVIAKLPQDANYAL